MATNFPTSLDNGTSLPYPTSGNFTNAPSLSGGQDNQNDALIAVETKLGTGASTPSGTNLLVSTGTGTSGWSKTAPVGTIVGTSDSQTLTNKTLTSPTINSPTITNATISADSITGFTTSSNGTVYGMSVAGGVLASAAILNAVNTAALQNGAVTSSKIAAGGVAGLNLGLSLAANNIYYNGSGTTTYTMTTSYAAVTGLTTPSITLATAGIILVIGTVNIAQASATSADAFFRVIMGSSTVPNYPTAGEIQNTFSSATSNLRASASVCFIFTGVSAGTYTLTAQATATAGTFRVDNTHTNLLVIPLTS